MEIKSKNGLLGKKDSYPLIPFELNQNFKIDKLNSVFKKSEIPDSLYDTLRSFTPALLNRYQRKYYQSKDRRFRVTLDYDQSFFQAGPYNNSFMNRHRDDVSVILELKYDKDSDNYAENITQTFPFRMSKNSKYVKGIENLYSW